MPHVTLDYSANLEALVALPEVCEAVRKAALETGIFPLGGTRVRAFRADHASIADGDSAHAYLDCVLKIGHGRDQDTKQRAGDHIFAVLTRALEPAFAKTTFALSMEIREIDPVLTWKRNTIHDALKARQTRDDPALKARQTPDDPALKARRP